jgi:hypothetical protein
VIWYRLPESDRRKGPPAGDNTRGNPTHTAQRKVCVCVFALLCLGSVWYLSFASALTSLALSFLVGLARSGACAPLRFARLFM